MAVTRTVELGDVARDTVTGFEGVVLGITAWLTGCRQVGLQPQKVGKDGEPVKVQWFDEPRCQIRRRAAVAVGPTLAG